MKKYLIAIGIGLILCGRFGSLLADEYRPGVQAQGVLDGNNIQMNHATGIFNYNIPLLELTSGDFHLPISLGYTAKGVKKETPRGMLFYNWNLNTGGMVTRVVRGCMADEVKGDVNIGRGSAWIEYKDSFTEQILKNTADGEADLFVANFNGRSVRFCLKYEANKMVVKPLEPTEVKISYEYDGSQHITAWQVVDETGIKYVYREQEWTRGIACEKPMGYNSYAKESHISSWLLSRIEIPGTDPILFDYEIFVYDNEKTINLYPQYNFSAVSMHYGCPLYYLRFDDVQFELEYKKAMERVGKEIEKLIIRQQINMGLKLTWAEPFYDPWEKKELDFNYRILGIANNLKGSSFASKNLYDQLTELINLYDKSPHVLGALSDARSAIYNAWKYETVKTAPIGTSSGGMVYTPLLKRISTRNQVLRFEYDHLLPEIRLMKMVLADRFRRDVASVGFSYNGRHDYSLSDVVIQRKGVAQENYNFLYNLNECRSWDKWGFNCELAYRSLQKIVTPHKGEIEIGYERNCSEIAGGFEIYNGMRLRHLVLKDRLGHCDSILYRYPLRGICVYDSIGLREYVEYKDLSLRDTVVFDRYKTYSWFSGNFGNEGTYYPYVEEERVGEGVCAYLFFVAKNQPGKHEYCPDYLSGLLLGKALYDRDRHIVELCKNKYWLPMVVNGFPGEEKWFEACARNNYFDVWWQYKINPFRVDCVQLKRYYDNMGPIYTYGGYVDPKIFYEYNVKPREQVKTSSFYPIEEIVFGMSPLLKEQKVWHFTNQKSSTLSVNTIRDGLPTGAYLVSEMAWRYDDLEGARELSPKTIKREANGDERMFVTRTALDFEPGINAVIDSMRTRNCCRMAIKDQEFLKKNGQAKWQLICEKVNVFGQFRGQAGEAVFRVMENYEIYPKNTAVANIPAKDNALFTFTKQAYNKQQETVYQKCGGSILPQSVTRKADREVYLYDTTFRRPLLKITDAGAGRFDAIDCYRLCGLNNRKLSGVLKDPDITILQKYLRIHQDLLKEYPENYGQYMHYHAGYVQLIDLLEYFFAGDPFSMKLSRSTFSVIPGFREAFSTWKKEIGERFTTADTIAMVQTLKSCRGIYPEDEADDLLGMYYLERDAAAQPYRLSALIEPGAKEYRLLVVYKPVTEPKLVRVKVNCTGGSYWVEPGMLPGDNGDWKCMTFDIDLSAYQSVVSLETDFSESDLWIACAALAPANAVYEMTACEVNGLPFCRTDQNGMLEYFEYDYSGRVTKVYDRERNLLKQFTYQ